ncbi:MAG: type II secretion system protein [Bdellovibrionales bacterium]
MTIWPIKNKKGFTLIEVLMVILLVGILSSVAITQFINFQDDAREAAVSGNLAALRGAIANQYAQMQLRCGANSNQFPAAADIQANDITNGSSVCTIADVTTAADRAFIVGGIPANPYGSGATADDVVACTDCDRTNGLTATCDGGVAYDNTWCYDSSTGEIWADSANVEGL